MTDHSVPSTCDFDQQPRAISPSQIVQRYDELQSAGSVHWAAQYRMLKSLGAGSQSDVWLADRLGSLGVSMRVALKMFSPIPYPDTDTYLSEMAQTAQVAMRIVEVQQDHLLDVHNFVESGGIQIMVMEWVDGFDLKQLLAPSALEHAAEVAGREHWTHISDVVVASGPEQARLKAGVAIEVLRECLAGLAELHRRRIIHGDIKPSNIMLKRTGSVKIIDFGSAFRMELPRIQPAWTPRYAAAEVIETGQFTLNSDLASLGYVFLELLSGRVPFDGIETRQDLLAAKRVIHDQLDDWLPRDIQRDDDLMELIRGMIHPDPTERFESPAVAELSEHGAAAAHRRLVLGDLSSEYSNEIREWLQFFAPRDAD